MAMTMAQLRRQVQGVVLTPDAPGFAEEIAVFNTAIAHHPVIVVGAETETDVVAAVNFAAANHLGVAVMSTGHGQFLDADGAVLITTRRMNSVRIDQVERVATLSAGVRWRQVLDDAASYGLAPLSGSTSAVGVIGYLLGGGLGLLARKYGFAADHILRLRVVTADGAVRTADRYTNPNLFWAIRGGKGNFGIVTEVQIRLFPVTEVYAASVYFDADSIGPVLRRYAHWTRRMAEEITTSIAILRVPDLPDLPVELRGRTLAHLRFVAVINGSGQNADPVTVLEPMLAAGRIVRREIGRRPYNRLDFVHDDVVEPLPIWQRSGQLHALSDDVIEVILAATGPGADCRLTMVEIRHLGGALRRPPLPGNAVAGRDAAFSILFLGLAFEPVAKEVTDNGDKVMRQLGPHLTGRKLVNWLGWATAPEEVGEAWDERTRQRLLAIKSEIDPENVFRFGHPLVAAPRT
jgi:FAD/FMN-containing dehydrogenase